MIYDIDTIPVKIYFKILETNNLSLLSDEIINEEDLKTAWKNIINHPRVEKRGKEKQRAFEITKTIEALVLKHKTLSNALLYLSTGNRDDELEKIVKSYGYVLTELNFKNNVLKAIKDIEIIHNRISKNKQDLDNLIKKEQSGENLTLEDVLIGYATILGITTPNANTITLLSYLGLDRQVKLKIKSLEKEHKK